MRDRRRSRRTGAARRPARGRADNSGCRGRCLRRANRVPCRSRRRRSISGRRACSRPSGSSQRGDADAGGDRDGLALARGRERATVSCSPCRIGDAKQPLAFRRERDLPVAALRQCDAEVRFGCIWRLTADCVTQRSCAASVMLMRRPTATKPRTSRATGGGRAALTCA